jgi:hypothetical protein
MIPMQSQEKQKPFMQDYRVQDNYFNFVIGRGGIVIRLSPASFAKLINYLKHYLHKGLCPFFPDPFKSILLLCIAAG